MKPLYSSSGVRSEKRGWLSHPRLRHSLFLVPAGMVLAAQNLIAQQMPPTACCATHNLLQRLGDHLRILMVRR